MSGDHDKYHGTAEVPKREWVGLTEEEAMSILLDQGLGLVAALACAIEAKLKEKNT
jgi:hypothetical protein